MRYSLARAALILVAASGSLTAQTSNFASGAEGWRTGDLFAPDCCSTPVWVSSGGMPGGGFIRTSDIYPWNAYWAPSAYLGDKSSSYGGSFSFWTRIVSSDGLAYPNVVLHGAGKVLRFITMPPANDVWTNFDIPMLETGWTYYAGGSGAVTASDFLAVLADLDRLAIDADWRTGADRVDLDGVTLTGVADPGVVPEPSTFLLLAGGLAGVAGAAVRNRRRR